MNIYPVPELLTSIGAVAYLFCIHFNAKLLKSVELKREAMFSEFSSDFLLILFFPIGIWIIQPRLNKIIRNAIS